MNRIATRGTCGLLLALLLGGSNSANAEAISIERSPAPIAVDGDLSEEGWEHADPVTTWFETNPGDSLEPKVDNVAYVTYNDQFFYAAFEFEDPEPSQIRASISDRDNVPSSISGQSADSPKP